MGDVPEPRTWVVGETVSATLLNTEIRDYFNWTLDTPRCLLGTSSTQSITNDGELHKVTWNVEHEESDLTHSSGSSDITVTTPGLYLVVANIEYAANGTFGYRLADIFVNGDTATANKVASGNVGPPSNIVCRISIAAYQRAVVGDVFNVMCAHNAESNTNITTNCNFGAVWMEA